MFRTKLRLNPLDERKQLLLAESEVNRIQLATECAALSEQLQVLGAVFRPLLSAAGWLISGVRAGRGAGSENPGKQGSTLWTVLDALHSGLSLWNAIKPRPR